MSAVVHITPAEEPAGAKLGMLERITAAAFGQRRKMLTTEPQGRAGRAGWLWLQLEHRPAAPRGNAQRQRNMSVDCKSVKRLIGQGLEICGDWSRPCVGIPV
jgi:16S rRNA A1518/A1519 N6-dimethyltransferase RsmA/KsgA/DIM1 with predicted DNA glycosylase/AP lyase activity